MGCGRLCARYHSVAFLNGQTSQYPETKYCVDAIGFFSPPNFSFDAWTQVGFWNVPAETVFAWTRHQNKWLAIEKLSINACQNVHPVCSTLLSYSLIINKRQVRNILVWQGEQTINHEGKKAIWLPPEKGLKILLIATDHQQPLLVFIRSWCKLCFTWTDQDIQAPNIMYSCTEHPLVMFCIQFVMRRQWKFI